MSNLIGLLLIAQNNCIPQSAMFAAGNFYFNRASYKICVSSVYSCLRKKRSDIPDLECLK